MTLQRSPLAQKRLFTPAGHSICVSTYTFYPIPKSIFGLDHFVGLCDPYECQFQHFVFGKSVPVPKNVLFWFGIIFFSAFSNSFHSYFYFHSFIFVPARIFIVHYLRTILLDVLLVSFRVAPSSSSSFTVFCSVLFQKFCVPHNDLIPFPVNSSSFVSSNSPDG